jgi:protein-disulfide isomerase
MLRRLLVILIRRSFLVLILICLGCAAQSTQPDTAGKPDLTRAIERQVRSYYSIPPDVKVQVGAIVPSSDWPGYDMVPVTIDGGDGKKQDYKFLVAQDRKTMLRMVKFDLTKDPFTELMSKINVSGRPVRGAKSSKVVVVNFDDLQCPFCSRMHEAMFPEILKDYGDRVTFVYKDYPLSEIHPWAMHAAVDANCLAAQNGDAYWDFADYIHAHPEDVKNEKTPGARLAVLDRLTLDQGQKHSLDKTKLEACVKAQDETAVKASVKEGDEVGVSATPTLFVNGEKVDGVIPILELRAMLDRALKEAGQPVPVRAAPPAAPASK